MSRTEWRCDLVRHRLFKSTAVVAFCDFREPVLDLNDARRVTGTQHPFVWYREGE